MRELISEHRNNPLLKKVNEYLILRYNDIVNRIVEIDDDRQNLLLKGEARGYKYLIDQLSRSEIEEKE